MTKNADRGQGRQTLPMETQGLGIDAIILQFSEELLHDSRGPVTEFHFGCTSSRIVWDDRAVSGKQRAPRVAVSFTMEELGQARYVSITPPDLHANLFGGRHRKRFAEALYAALELEQEVSDSPIGAASNLREVRKKMERARKAAMACLRSREYTDDELAADP